VVTQDCNGKILTSVQGRVSSSFAQAEPDREEPLDSKSNFGARQMVVVLIHMSDICICNRIRLTVRLK
jgi:hypothetical protein